MLLAPLINETKARSKRPPNTSGQKRRVTRRFFFLERPRRREEGDPSRHRIAGQYSRCRPQRQHRRRMHNPTFMVKFVPSFGESCIKLHTPHLAEMTGHISRGRSTSGSKAGLRRGEWEGKYEMVTRPVICISHSNLWGDHHLEYQRQGGWCRGQKTWEDGYATGSCAWGVVQWRHGHRGRRPAHKPKDKLVGGPL